MRVLVLGGTTEANALVSRLAANPGLEVIVSLAGRTAHPVVPAGQVRRGGFGGVAGLADYLAREGIGAVVDATHPFAARMPFNAAEACAQQSVPLVKLTRPPWTPAAGAQWTGVADLDGAARALVARGSRRVLLTTGRQELDPFRGLSGVRFVIRSIEAADLSGFVAPIAVLARGPFSLADERALLAEHGVDTLVSKNSGGSATAAKLQAAHELGVGVVMVRRPPLPDVALVSTIGAARDWVSAALARLDTSEG
jgi:precorrin-6A/cobalt-precorrin-6A reductase